jgi:hypothetical protein
MSLLSRSSTFGSARMTGLDAIRGTPIVEPGGQRKPAKAAAAKSVGGETVSVTKSAVAVLEAEERDEVDDAEPDEPDEPRERRHTTPQEGSAAERAAARRARLRGESEKGES